MQGMRTLLEHIGSATLNQVMLPRDDHHAFPLLSKPTPLKARTFELLGLDPEQTATRRVAA